MGLFGNLFEKKYCSICGNEIKLLGNKKLEDGNMCKDCERKLSPFFTGRRHTTIDDIKEQLAYREENLQAVDAFNPTLTLGNGRKVIVDEAARKFIVTSSGKWRDENPDVIDFSQVTGVNVDVRESRTEITYTDKDGNEQSYAPPRYDIDYDIYCIIHVNSPWFDKIEVKVNDSRIEEARSAKFLNCQAQAEEIKKTLMAERDAQAAAHAAAQAPKTAATCPHCGATTVPDAMGRCEYCGGAMG